jgi:hypothetical protein
MVEENGKTEETVDIRIVVMVAIVVKESLIVKVVMINLALEEIAVINPSASSKLKILIPTQTTDNFTRKIQTSSKKSSLKKMLLGISKSISFLLV